MSQLRQAATLLRELFSFAVMRQLAGLLFGIALVIYIVALLGHMIGARAGGAVVLP